MRCRLAVPAAVLRRAGVKPLAVLCALLADAPGPIGGADSCCVRVTARTCRTPRASRLPRSCAVRRSRSASINSARSRLAENLRCSCAETPASRAGLQVRRPCAGWYPGRSARVNCARERWIDDLPLPVHLRTPHQHLRSHSPGSLTASTTLSVKTGQPHGQ
jgi:hypothetical protein